MKLRIDDELKYCPECHDEYRAEIETCAACSVQLVTGVELKAFFKQKQQRQDDRSMEISPDQELVDIRKGPVMQIKHYQKLLASENLPSLVVQEGSGCGKGCCGTDVVLRVRLSDIQDVMAVLEEEHVRTTGLSEHDTANSGAVFNTRAEQTTCPACGFVFPPTTKTCPDCGLCFA